MTDIEIKGKSYSEEYLEKAITFYNALNDGSIFSEIKEEIECTMN